METVLSRLVQGAISMDRLTIKDSRDIQQLEQTDIGEDLNLRNEGESNVKDDPMCNDWPSGHVWQSDRKQVETKKNNLQWEMMIDFWI